MKRYRVILKNGASFTVTAKGIAWDGSQGKQFTGTKEGAILKFGFVEPVEEYCFLEDQIAAVTWEQVDQILGPEAIFRIRMKSDSGEGTDYVSATSWSMASSKAHKRAVECHAELMGIERAIDLVKSV